LAIKRDGAARDAVQRHAWCRRDRRHPGLTIAHGTDAQAAVRGADIVCTVTSSPTPVLLGDWLEPGQHLIAAGFIGRDHLRAEIGEVLGGTAPGRGGAGEITLYRSLGIAAQDLAAAHHVCAAGRGQKVRF